MTDGYIFLIVVVVGQAVVQCCRYTWRPKPLKARVPRAGHSSQHPYRFPKGIRCTYHQRKEQ